MGKFQNFTIEYISLYLNKSLKAPQKMEIKQHGENIVTMSEKSQTIWLINTFFIQVFRLVFWVKDHRTQNADPDSD